MRRTLILLAALLGGCSGEPAASGKVLIWARGGDSRTLDPAQVEYGEDAKITQNVFETLVAYKDDSVELEPRLATRWTFSDDGRTLTFELRENVVFHDGTTFDADDVVFTFGRLLDPKHPHAPRAVPYASSFGNIVSVKADGPRKAVFTLKAPSVVMLHNLALFGAAVVSPEAVAKEGEAFGRRPVGTGPYRMARWEKDVKIELAAFDRYWGRKPSIPLVIVVPVPSPQTAVEKLKRGEVHAIDHPTPSDARALQADPAMAVHSLPGMNVVYLAFNLRKEPYSDRRLREAIGLALDRAAINERVFNGLGTIATNLVPPSVWPGEPLPPYAHDPAKAKAALAALKPPELEIIYNTLPRPYNPEPQRLAEAIRDQLAAVGLRVRLTGYDRPAFEVKYKEPGHAMYISGWLADIQDPDNFFHPLLHGESKKDMNASFFDDPAFNTAVSDAQKEADPAKRRALYATAAEVYRRELPTISLTHLPQIVIARKNVKYRLHAIEYRFYTADLGE
ncbi:MAG TPA: ABC transporter substrate-binding protein [Planctomycetota bacterium]|nr:ABC transporter substrate-binding protein [Planctomycetota bacterium]